MSQSSTSHYSFGDNAVAAARLERLAAAYAVSSAAFLSEALPRRTDRAADLGCGLGLTTALLSEISAAQFVVGYERSPQYVEAARARFAHLSFREIDVLSFPYPDENLDVIYCRFLLTHLHRPECVLRASIQQLRPGGRLLLEEVSGLSADLPELQRYYSLVQEMQAHYGQELYIGLRLPALAASLSDCRVRAEATPIRLSTSSMARLHAMNIASWKHDAHMLKTHGLHTLEELEVALNTLAESSSIRSPVTCLMAQVVVERA